MSNQEANNSANAIDFSHRINSDFYESMLGIMSRIAGLADVVEAASRLDDGGLTPDSVPAAAHAIRLEASDAKSMLQAWQKGRFE